MIPPRRDEPDFAQIEIAVERHFPPPGRGPDDFQDDDGTPSWRSAQGGAYAAPTTTHIRQQPPRPGLLGRWRRLGFFQKALLAVFFGWVLPWAIIVFGILGIALWGLLFDR